MLAQRSFMIAVAALLSGCATPVPPDAAAGASECEVRLRDLDAAVADAGLRDAEGERVPGVPYLRSTRVLRSFRDELALPSMRATWLHHLRATDQAAWRGEIGNFGTHRAAPLLGYAPSTPVPFLLQAIATCGRELVERDIADPKRLSAIRRAVPPEPLQAPPATTYHPLATTQANAMSQAFADGLRTPPDLTSTQRVVLPDASRPRLQTVAALVQSRRRDTLGFPRLTEPVIERLLRTHAPVLILVGDDDATAASRVVLHGSQRSPRPGLDTSSPTVYTRLHLAREGGSIRIQLVYGIWLGIRGSNGVMPLYLRVTLDSAGMPLRFEAMRGNGDLLVLPIGAPEAHPSGPGFALAPAASGQRLRVRIDVPTAAVTGLDYASETASSAHYSLVTDAVLRTLPVDGDPRRRASLYQANGNMHGPSGPLGRVRQWGHQRLGTGLDGALANRYFDSPTRASSNRSHSR